MSDHPQRCINSGRGMQKDVHTLRVRRSHSRLIKSLMTRCRASLREAHNCLDCCRILVLLLFHIWHDSVVLPLRESRLLPNSVNSSQERSNTYWSLPTKRYSFTLSSQSRTIEPKTPRSSTGNSCVPRSKTTKVERE